MKMHERLKPHRLRQIVVIVTVLFCLGVISLLTGCATSEPAATPEPVAEITYELPDFYDRLGNACWRYFDLIVCDDGYGSWEDDEDQSKPEAPMFEPEANYHSHGWMKESSWRSDRGKVVCLWSCMPYTAEAHTTITEGNGMCPYPSNAD